MTDTYIFIAVAIPTLVTAALIARRVYDNYRWQRRQQRAKLKANRSIIQQVKDDAAAIALAERMRRGK